jgi:copper chaperone NosL
MQRAFRFIPVLIVLGLLACTGELEPVDIENGDMCSFCRMAISEKQYAAEMIMADETVLKFDDIGCLLRYEKGKAGHPAGAAAVFVADSESKKWLKADDAFFVRSTTLKTPMGSGIIAFSSAEKAGAGSVRFAELQVK